MAAYRVGEVVWARIKGFPFWPSVVMDPADGMEVKPPKKKNVYYVRFLDVNDKNQIAWVSADEIKEFREGLPKFKADAEAKGGKMYGDLKKCIAVGEQAHQAFLEDIARNSGEQPLFGLWANGDSTAAEPAQSAVKLPKTPKTATKGSSKKVEVPESASSSTPVARAVRIKTAPKRALFGEDEPSPRARTTPAKKITAAKKRPAPEEATPTKTNGSANKKAKGDTAAGVASIAAEQPVSKTRYITPTVNTNGKSEVLSMKGAKEISLGLIGLDDERTVHVARKLLEKGVSVRVWAKDSLSKDLEYARAERIGEAGKIFEEADVVFITAPTNRELQTLLAEEGHLLMKVRASGKNKIKGVCVFSALTKQESVQLARHFQPKNLLFLDCAWIGSKEYAASNQLSLVASGDRRLFDQCKPLLETVCHQATYLSEELGQAQIYKAAVEIATGVALAGFAEAAHFAQQNGLDLKNFAPAVSHLLGNDVVPLKVQQILDFGSRKKNNTASIFKEQYVGLRDAFVLAHPSSGPSNVTPMAAAAMDMCKTQFMIYRYEREQDRLFEEMQMGDVKEEEISSSGSGSERGGRGEEDKLPARSARGPNTVTGPQPAAIETAMEAMDVEPVAVETMLSGVGLIMTSNETLSIPSTSGSSKNGEVKISEGPLANGRQQLQAGVNENGGQDEEEESSGEESDDEEEEEVEEEGVSTQETDTSGEGDRLNESA